MIAKNELHTRISRLQALMKASNCQGFLITQNTDMYYFSGTIQNGQLYLPQDGEPLLFCRKSVARAHQECPWAVIPVDSCKTIPGILTEMGFPLPQCLALEMDVIPASNYLSLSRIFSAAQMVDGSDWIKQVRSIKSPLEIDLLRSAGRLMAEVYREAPQFFQAGRSEIECASDIERLARRLGHQGLVRFRAFNQELFFGHFLSGPSGGEPSFVDGASGGTGLGGFFPQGSSMRIIQANEPISLDYVGVFNGYSVDQTRMFVIGSLPANLQTAFDVALKIQDDIIAMARPGAIPSVLYSQALKIAQEAGLQDHFQGYRGNQTRFIGHGIGLELDELPILAPGYDEALQAGMVFALEPKFVFPGLGMAGIENTWLVTRDGVEKITNFPDDLIQIPKGGQ